MLNNKIFRDKYKESVEFYDVLKKFTIANNQININEDLVKVFNNYDRNLRIIFVDLMKCKEIND